MAELTAVAVQTVSANGNVLFTEDIGFRGCNRRYVYHRPGTGTVSVRGLSEKCYNRIRVFFGGNIAVPTGGTVGEISLAIAVNGEVIPSTEMVFTPAAVEVFGSVSNFATLDIPGWLPQSISVVNTGEEDVLVRNANLIVTSA